MSKSRIVRVWITVACLSLVISACSSSPKKQGKEEPKNTEIKSFQAPEIPPVYTDQRERAKYLVTHYWDKFNFADTSLIRMPEITEQAFVDFLQVLPYVSYTDAEKEISGMLDKALSADTLMFAYFTVLYDKYLYNPNSPMLNEVEASGVVKNLLNTKVQGNRKKLVFLSVFPDPELEVWRRMLPEQPKEWMCTYDDGQVITKERLYDLRAIPTFYLLDREKRVLLKDAPFRVIETYLGERL